MTTEKKGRKAADQKTITKLETKFIVSPDPKSSRKGTATKASNRVSTSLVLPSSPKKSRKGKAAATMMLSTSEVSMSPQPINSADAEITELLRTGQISANEARRRRGLPPFDGGEALAVEELPPSSGLPDLANHIATLRELAVQRRAAIKLKVKIDNGTRALVGRACGFHIDLPEKERAVINKRAGAIIAAIEKGKPIDDPVAAPLAPFILTGAQGRAPFDALRLSVEKDMQRLAEFMPVYHFVEELKGFAALGLAIIVGEAGDLGAYAGPAKLWKRMGLAVMNGRRQGNPGKGATAEDWIAHGYNKERRSMMWQIMDLMMKHQWTGDKDADGNSAMKSKLPVAVPAHGVGPYGVIYGQKKADYVARIELTADLPAGDPNKWTPARADKAARRYVEKRLLRDLWRAWRAASLVSSADDDVPPAEPISLAAE